MANDNNATKKSSGLESVRGELEYYLLFFVSSVIGPSGLTVFQKDPVIRAR